MPAWLQQGWLDGYSEYMEKTPRDRHEQILLPCMMRDYADALERYLGILRSLRNHPVCTNDRCPVIYHVKQKAGRYCDPEVCELVGAAEDRESYTTSAHRKWRRMHETLIGRLGSLYPLLSEYSPL